MRRWHSSSRTQAREAAAEAERNRAAALERELSQARDEAAHQKARALSAAMSTIERLPRTAPLLRQPILYKIQPCAK